MHYFMKVIIIIIIVEFTEIFFFKCVRSYIFIWFIFHQDNMKYRTSISHNQFSANVNLNEKKFIKTLQRDKRLEEFTILQITTTPVKQRRGRHKGKLALDTWLDFQAFRRWSMRVLLRIMVYSRRVHVPASMGGLVISLYLQPLWVLENGDSKQNHQWFLSQ